MTDPIFTLRQREQVYALADMCAAKGRPRIAALLRTLARRLYAAERPGRPSTGAGTRTPPRDPDATAALLDPD